MSPLKEYKLPVVFRSSESAACIVTQQFVIGHTRMRGGLYNLELNMAFERMDKIAGRVYPSTAV